MTRTKDNRISWAVLGLVSFSLFLEVGLVKSFSVLLPDIKEEFNTYTWVVGSSVSIIVGCGCVIGLSASAFANRFGPRVCLMVCGMMSTIGLVICSCAPNALVLLLGLVLSGFLYLQEIVAIGVIPDYFDKYYNTAVSVYSCGSGFGIIVMPLLTQTFLEIYGWRGALLLLSGLCFQSVPCGAMLFRSDEKRPKGKTNILFSKTRSSKENYSNGYDDVPSNLSKLTRALSAVFLSPLLSKPSFITQVLIPSIAWGYTYVGWLIYIVSFSLSNGTSMREASIVGTCGGIGLTAVRVVLPPLNQVLTYKQLMHISSLLSAIALALTNIFNTFLGLCMMSVIFGAGFGILGAELYIAIKEITTEKEYVLAVAWANLIHGLAAIASGFFTGWLFDMTGSFIVSFGLLAAISLLTSLSLGLEEIINGCNRHRSAAI